MKVYLLLLLLLLPLCLASDQQFKIECYGEDFLMVNNLLLQCTGKVQQACYTRQTGEKGCTRLENCSQPGWTCCHTDRCNA
ncbi:uncharacterized protein wu:fj16a03 [Kryptolebias marmoratus]|uniref:uncharacterized protein wu:fj16a03 n=1 Tax=Kryptolebias marmoratus TaxID=37003 RepID=UPI0018ACA2D9|nr:uncharacterized protein wu:fj16a03 [Kryptolebias marmoratus]